MDLFYKNTHSHRDYEEETPILIAKLRYKFKDIKKDRWEEILQLLHDRAGILWFLFKLENATTESIKDKDTRLLSLGSTTTLASLELVDLSQQSWTKDYSKSFSQIPGLGIDVASTVELDSGYQSELSDTESLHYADLETKQGLFSWEKFKETDANSPFLTECGYEVFQQAYSQFTKSPLDSEAQFVSMKDLVSKLLLLCNGFASDIFAWDGEQFQLADPIRSGGIGCEALKSLLRPFMEHGMRVRSLSELASGLDSNLSSSGLTGAAIGRAITTWIKEMYSQTVSLTSRVQNSSMPVLNLLNLVEPLFKQTKVLLRLLQKHSRGSKGTLLLPFIYEELLRQERIHCNEATITMLIYVLQQGLVPMMKWLDFWLQISTEIQNVWDIHDLKDLDPFNEFFIQSIDEHFEFVNSFPFPQFLPAEFAQEIFEIGSVWRTISRGSVMKLGSTIPIQSRWLLQSDHILHYQSGINAYSDSILYEYKKSIVEDQMRRLQEMQAIQQDQLEKLEIQRLADQARAELKAEQRMQLIQKKQELKNSIERFLEDRRQYIANQVRMEKNRTESEIQKSKNEAEERQRVLFEEMEALRESYEKAMERIEKVSSRLDWRRRRVELDQKRRDFLGKEWTDSGSTDYAKHDSRHREDSERINNEKIETPFVSEVVMKDPSSVGPLVVPGSDTQSDPPKSNFSSPTKSVEMSDVGRESEAPADSSYVHASELPESVTTQPSPSVVSDNLSTSQKLQWILDGSIAPLPIMQESSTSDIYEPYQIMQYQREMGAALINIDETLAKTAIELWKQQLRLLSTVSLGHVFSSAGRVDPKDLRYYLEMVKSYYFFGSGHFQTKIVDKFFKDSSNGLSLNSRISNRYAGPLSKLTWDLLDNGVSSKGEIYGNTLSQLVKVDLAGIEKGLSH
jgi:hypothetical protein